jgi:hypothetical protein
MKHTDVVKVIELDMKHEDIVKVLSLVDRFGAKIAESLLYRDLVDLVERNGITKQNITISGTKKRRIYGFSTITNLDVTDKEYKHLDRSVRVGGQGLCMIVEYDYRYRMITDEKLQKELAHET